MPTLPSRHLLAGVAYGQQRQQLNDQRRGSASSRGYDRRWQAFRRMFLDRHPLCADCEAKDVVEPAGEVHHIRKVRDAPELRLVETNCLALCKGCHSVRTARGE